MNAFECVRVCYSAKKKNRERTHDYERFFDPLSQIKYTIHAGRLSDAWSRFNICYVVSWKCQPLSPEEPFNRVLCLFDSISNITVWGMRLTCLLSTNRVTADCRHHFGVFTLGPHVFLLPGPWS